MLNPTAQTTVAFAREHMRAPLTLALLVAIPVFFVLIFASVLGDLAKALGGTLAVQSATAISAGWAAAFLSATLAFFQVNSSRSADRRLAAAGLGATRVAVARICASVVSGAVVTAVAFVTLWLRSGIGHPAHAAVAIFGFAVIYIGIGALIGTFVRGELEGSLLVLLLFTLDAFTTPEMTSSSPFAWTPTRSASELLLAAGGGQTSTTGAWSRTVLVSVISLVIAIVAFWRAARTRT